MRYKIMCISAFVSKYINWEFGELSNYRSLRASAHTGVAISIEFQAAYRHPSVGAVIDRPQKYDEFQNKVR